METIILAQVAIVSIVVVSMYTLLRTVSTPTKVNKTK